MNLVAMTDHGVANPAFDKFKDAHYEIMTKQYISLPIYSHDGKLIATLQVESKFHVHNI